MSGELARAASVIRRGGVIAYATEYCFGLGCDPMNRAAVLRLLRIKRRPGAPALEAITVEGGFALQGQRFPVQSLHLPVQARSLMESKTEFDFG